MKKRTRARSAGRCLVLFFGSEFDINDRIAWEICRLLRGKLEKMGCDVEQTDEPDVLLSRDLSKYKETIIVDAAKGVDDIVELDDVSQLQTTRVHTVHGYNLGMLLQILEATGDLPNVRIIAIPYGEKDVKSSSEKALSLIMNRARPQ